MTRKTPMFPRLLALLTTSIVFSAGALAETFPTKPVRIVVPFAAGGTADILARLLQEPLQRRLGQPVIVENKIGAGGSVGNQFVKNAPADGHTLLLSGNSTITTPLVQKAATYDGVQDFAPISVVATTPMVLLVNASTPVHSVPELVKYAQERPGALEYASSGRGSLGHLVTEAFMQAAQLNMLYVPYQSSAQAVNAVLAGDVKVLITTPSTALGSYVQAGKIRMLGVSTQRPSALLPRVPAIAESVPNFAFSAWFGVAAPQATPPAVLAKLNEAINAAVAEPAFEEKLKTMGMSTARKSPAEFAQMVSDDRQFFATVIRQAGIQPE